MIMGKKRLLIVLFIFCIGVLVLYCINKPTREEKVVAFYEENKQELEAIALSQLEGDDSVDTYKDVTVDGVFVNSDYNSIVQFLYSGEGIAPSGKYYGLYYSPTDTPAAFQNIDISLEEDNGSWVWNEGNSDNGGVTKRISEGWYYYEAWF